MRSRFLLAVVFLFCIGCTLHAQNLEWLGGQKMGGVTKDRGNTMTVDNNGNVTVSGTFLGTANFGGQSLVSGGKVDSYVASFNSSGALRWVRGFGGTDTSALAEVYAIAADSSGNVLAIGSFAGTVRFGSISLTTDRVNMFLVKLNESGNVLWAQQAGDRNWKEYPGGCIGAGVAVDRSGDVFVTGTIDDSVYFGNHLLYGEFNDIFIARYSSSGVAQWARRAGGPFPDNGQDIAVDPDGNPVITGVFGDTAAFGAIELKGYGWEDVYIAKYDASGNAQWARNAGSVDRDFPFAIATDMQGNIYTTGFYVLPMSFGTVTLPVNGQIDMYLAKYNASGVLQWVNRSYGFGTELSAAVTTDAEGNVYTSGALTGRGVFGKNNQGVVESQGSGDAFVTKYNGEGVFQWVRTAGSSPDDTGHAANAVVVSPSGDIYIAGTFYDEITLGSLVLKSSGSSDAFLARLGNPGTFPSISGTVYDDQDGDGMRDVAEPGLRQRMIQLTPGPIYATTDSSGLYKLYLDEGTYTVQQIVRDYWRHTAPTNPATYTVSIDGTDTAAGRDFGTQAIPGIQDLVVTVTNIWPARPGFEQYYVITYYNRGTTTVDGTITFHHDPLLIYDIAEPLPTAQIGNELKWAFEDLVPGESRDIIVNMALSPAVELNQTLTSYVAAEPFLGDTTVTDNRDTLLQVTQGSYDPNDIAVLPWVEEGGSVVYPGQPLTYIVRFQNTGTDTAFTVVIVDTLDRGLDPSTFEMESASHDYTYEIGEDGIVTWWFDKIMLPDVNRSELLSHGFLRFRITPKKGLSNGTLMHNRVAIYFDFNAPVITNTVTSRLTGVSSVDDIYASSAAGHYMYPAPLRTSSLLRLRGEYSGPYTVTLHDEAGKMVRTMENVRDNAIRIDRGNLVRGVYFYSVSSGSGAVAHGKFIVE